VNGYSDGDPQQEPAEPPRPDRKRAVGAAALLVVFVALASYGLIASGVNSAGRPSAPRAVAQAAVRPTAAASPRSATPVPVTGPSPSASPSTSITSSPAPSPVAVRLLTVASATAYGPDGASDGDHPDLAPGIINGGDGRAWQSSWYTTAEFGNLQSGTGLLLDMGETVNLSRVLLVLGTPAGADIQIRVGNMSLPAELPVAASAYDAGGTVELRVTPAASGRYVLIWFTQLPRNSQGKYQASVYSATVYGTKRTLFAALDASHRANLMRSVVIQLPYVHDNCGAWHFGHTTERNPLLRRATARVCASVPRAPGQPAPGGLPGAAARARHRRARRGRLRDLGLRRR
jgi:hypothetical protein